MCPPHHGLGAPEPAQSAYYFPDDQQAARSARARARRKEKSDLEIAIQDSADYMTYNYADKSLSIEHLSQRAALSTCYYMRKFKEYQSATPHQFLQTVRLSAAKQQLLTTSQSIETIADNCGFSSASHFIMAFRKSTGITPHQYRTRWK